MFKPQNCLRSPKDKRALINETFRLKKRIIEAQTGIPIVLITMNKEGSWVEIPLRGSR